MAKLICISGMDGAGKNTLIDNLASELKSAYVANIWDIMDGGISEVPFKSKKDIDNYLCELTPDSRLLFLAHALKFSIDQALKSDKEYILLNAYYYKYFSSEIALGASTELVNALMKSFPEPDKIIYLNINMDVAAKRKKYFSRYECGLVSKPDIASFSDFQHKVSKFWDNYDKSNWITLNASLTPEELLNKTLKAIIHQ